MHRTHMKPPQLMQVGHSPHLGQNSAGSGWSKTLGQRRLGSHDIRSSKSCTTPSSSITLIRGSRMNARCAVKPPKSKPAGSCTHAFPDFVAYMRSSGASSEVPTHQSYLAGGHRTSTAGQVQNRALFLLGNCKSGLPAERPGPPQRSPRPQELCYHPAATHSNSAACCSIWPILHKGNSDPMLRRMP